VTALVTGVGGFIGGHLARALLDRGVPARAVDIKPLAEWHQLHREEENRVLDCAEPAGCREYPADPEDGYGREKLFSERTCRHFREDFGLATRVARFHNVYGPHGTWDDGRALA